MLQHQIWIIQYLLEIKKKVQNIFISHVGLLNAYKDHAFINFDLIFCNNVFQKKDLIKINNFFGKK